MFVKNICNVINTVFSKHSFIYVHTHAKMEMGPCIFYNTSESGSKIFKLLETN